jgi:hypothetical protein
MIMMLLLVPDMNEVQEMMSKIRLGISHIQQLLDERFSRSLACVVVLQ